MSRFKRGLFLVFLLGLNISPAALAGVQGQEVEYRSGATILKGYIAYDDANDGQRPGVIVVHEWWGQNEYVRKRADMLAGLGYVALAVDMFGDGKVTNHPDEAKEFSSAVFADLEDAEARFKAGMEVLEEFPLTNKDKIAAIGYCFGGGTVLHMARAGMDLDAVVSFHGSLSAKKEAGPGAIKAHVLVVTGSDDPMVPQEQVDAFTREMEAAGADFRVISYEGATHGFTNPEADDIAKEFGLPVAYNPQADESSWEEMKGFLKSAFDD